VLHTPIRVAVVQTIGEPERESMIPREFFDSASGEDLRFVRKWTLGVSALYSTLALALVLLSFAIHGGTGTTRAENPPDVNHTILARE
jgi:hypothetical protein